MKLNTQDLMHIFNVTMMTTTNWRFPHKSSQKSPLPFHTEMSGKERHRVFFVWGEVKKWSQENRVEIHTLPKDL
jgi:hypothetical protein